MKATAVAPSNIAFIKYWGKADEALRIPLNASISMNLSSAYTTTTVEFSNLYKTDEVYLTPSSETYKHSRPLEFVGSEKKRIIEHVDRIRENAGIHTRAKIVTRNTFPHGAGIASPASGFAALTVAACKAAGVTLSEKELTIIARLGSGSACRSIPDGFVLWEKGKISSESYAYSLYPADFWDVRDILVIVDFGLKKVSTSDGMKLVSTSPLWKTRVAGVPSKVTKMKTAFAEKDFTSLGELIEEDCLDMHHVMQTQIPPVFYWSDMTKQITKAVGDWRTAGLSVYFTVDAGPNVHLIVEGKDELEVLEKLKNFPGVLQVIVNKPAPGAHQINDHLF